MADDCGDEGRVLYLSEGALVSLRSLRPAFADPVHQAQVTFRCLLEAMAHPGRILTVPVDLEPPGGVMPVAAAVALTLWDDRTSVWMAPNTQAEITAWLQFHTGCRWSPSPHQAQFGLIRDPHTLPRLGQFNWGTPEEPESSTTLILEIPGFDQGSWFTLTGPGIPQQRSIQLDLGSALLVEDLMQQGRPYPQGVDLFLCQGHQLMGLPRSVICKGG